jgi:hypothetical protein
MKELLLKSQTSGFVFSRKNKYLNALLIVLVATWFAPATILMSPIVVFAAEAPVAGAGAGAGMSLATAIALGIGGALVVAEVADDGGSSSSPEPPPAPQPEPEPV